MPVLCREKREICRDMNILCRKSLKVWENLNIRGTFVIQYLNKLQDNMMLFGRN